MRLPVLLVGLLFTTAGCLGSDDDGGDTPADPDEPTPSGGAAGPGGPDEANGTAQLTWSSEDHTGTVTGINAAGAARLHVTGENAFSFDVPEGAARLHMNLTTTGGELDMFVAAPGCDVTPDATCEEVHSSSGGAAAVDLAEPDAGTWNVRFFANEPVANGVGYTVTVAMASVA